MTEKEQIVVNLAKQIMPQRFLESITDDNLILAYLNMVLAEFNWIPPRTGFIIDNFPPSLYSFLALGAQTYAVLFLAGGYALNDFSYSDGGLSLTINRQANLDSYQQKLFENYSRQATNIKKCMTTMLRVNVALTPTVNTVFAQYLGSMFPTTFSMFK